MTAALFHIEPAVAAAAGVGDVVELSGPEGRHAVAVKRVEVGERIDLGDGAGTVLHAMVEALHGRDSLAAAGARARRASRPRSRGSSSSRPCPRGSAARPPWRR